MSDMPNRVIIHADGFWEPAEHRVHDSSREAISVSWLRCQIEEAQEHLREPNELQSAELIQQGLVSAFDAVLRLIDESEEQTDGPN